MTRTDIRALAFWLALLFVLSGGVPAVYAMVRVTLSGSPSCHVTRIVDGDTVIAYCPREGFVRARLMGFDTPESWRPRCLGEWWGGWTATWALRWEIWTSGHVETVLSGRDRYGRRLMSLFL
ncbi:MAG: hypothetical protein D6754_13245, partial [Alphaproteobacteria bacterium]